MREKLLQLDSLLKNKNSQLIQHFNQGNKIEDIITFFSTYLIQISPTDDLFCLYNWHNGTKENNDEHCLNFCLFPDYLFLSLEKIMQITTTDYYYNFKSKKMIPIFSSCGGDFLAIKINEFNKTPNDCKIYFCSPRITNVEGSISMFDNFYIMIECIIQSYRNSFYFINSQDNIIDEDSEQVQNLFKTLNPKSSYWFSDELI
jgi:hypothetical protein